MGWISVALFGAIGGTMVFGIVWATFVRFSKTEDEEDSAVQGYPLGRGRCLRGGCPWGRRILAFHPGTFCPI